MNTLEFNVQEMNTSELEEVNGGGWFSVALAYAGVIAAAATPGVNIVVGALAVGSLIVACIEA
jgi:lactobin A/cerein 7B family class IIb bacteriocin